MVHGEPLDEVGERADEVLDGVGLQDARDDAVVVAHAVVALVGVRVQELVDDVGVVARDRLPDLRSGVAARERPGHGDEVPERGAVPGGGVGVGGAHKPEFLVRIIYKRAQVGPLALTHGLAEHDLDMLPYHPRAVVQDVHEGLVLTVQIAHEVLGALGEVQDGLQVDDLGEDGLLGGELLGQERQVLQGLRGRLRIGHGGCVLLDAGGLACERMARVWAARAKTVWRGARAFCERSIPAAEGRVNRDSPQGRCRGHRAAGGAGCEVRAVPGEAMRPMDSGRGRWIRAASGEGRARSLARAPRGRPCPRLYPVARRPAPAPPPRTTKTGRPSGRPARGLLVRHGGFEPSTLGLEVPCSIQLS